MVITVIMERDIEKGCRTWKWLLSHFFLHKTPTALFEGLKQGLNCKNVTVGVFTNERLNIWQGLCFSFHWVWIWIPTFWAPPIPYSAFSPSPAPHRPPPLRPAPGDRRWRRRRYGSRRSRGSARSAPSSRRTSPPTPTKPASGSSSSTTASSPTSTTTSSSSSPAERCALPPPVPCHLLPSRSLASSDRCAVSKAYVFLRCYWEFELVAWLGRDWSLALGSHVPSSNPELILISRCFSTGC